VALVKVCDSLAELVELCARLMTVPSRLGRSVVGMTIEHANIDGTERSHTVVLEQPPRRR
jgi:hypothetical protein